MIPTRKKKDSPRTNLIISLMFHSAIGAALFFFAAREGMLGKQLKKIAITMVPKERTPEKPKEPEPKMEPPKMAPEPAKTPQVVQPRLAAVPPPTDSAAPAVAPPPAVVSSFDFAGGKTVTTSSDPVAIYKGFVEYTLRSKWDRPEDSQDNSYVAELEMSIDPTGKITGSQWIKGSGDTQWDDSVRKAVAQTKSIGRPPPKGFPDQFLVRFDVQTEPMPILE